MTMLARVYAQEAQRTASTTTYNLDYAIAKMDEASAKLQAVKHSGNAAAILAAREQVLDAQALLKAASGL